MSNATAVGGPQTASTSKMTLPVFAKKVKKLASLQILNLKLLLNGRGFSKFKKNYKLKGEIGQGGFGTLFFWRIQCCHLFVENFVIHSIFLRHCVQCNSSK